MPGRQSTPSSWRSVRGDRHRVAGAAAPLAAALQAAGSGEIAPVARAGAALSRLGALLALIAGIGRTALAMARNHDPPGWLAGVHPRFRVPHHAEIALAVQPQPQRK